AGVDDRLGFADCALAHFLSLLHQPAEIIHRIEKYVVEVADFGFDIARHGEIDHQHRQAPPRFERAFDEPPADDRELARGTSHYDVMAGNIVGQIVERLRHAFEARGKLVRSLDGAVGKRGGTGPLSGKVRGGQFDHLAGADKENLLLRDAGIDALGDLHRSRRHRYRRFADLGVAAYLFGDVERLLEQLVQHQPERPSRLRGAHRLLHLTQDLRLTQDHGIEPARYAESMLDRTLPGQRV